MTLRTRALALMLWLAVIALSTWVGGTLYQMLVIVPLWSASPPESVRLFFQGTEYNRTIFQFFGPPFMIARSLPLLAALLLGWRFPLQRRALLLANVCMAFNLGYTIGHIYPINAVLFAQAGGNHSGVEIQAMADRWIFADRLRFAVGVVAFMAALSAFRCPLPDAARRGDKKMASDSLTHPASHTTGAQRGPE